MSQHLGYSARVSVLPMVCPFERDQSVSKVGSCDGVVSLEYYTMRYAIIGWDGWGENNKDEELRLFVKTMSYCVRLMPVTRHCLPTGDRVVEMCALCVTSLPVWSLTNGPFCCAAVCTM